MKLKFFKYLILITTVYGDRCRRIPSVQLGECVLFILWWSCSKPKDAVIEILEKFMCPNTYSGEINVCCPVVLKDVEQKHTDPIYDIIKLKNTKNCGIQTDHTDGDGIIGLYNFPWLVKLLFVNKFGEAEIEKVACTGVLINKRYVLYTIQCYNTIILQESNFVVGIEIFTGNLELCNTTVSSYNSNCRTFEIYEIEDMVLHPFYDPKTKFNDLAILKLSQNVQFSDYISPICLPLTSETSKYNVTYTAGWNLSLTPTNLSVKSSYVSVVISSEDCIMKSNSSNLFIPYDMCTTSENTIDNEIMGRPVMSVHNNRWYIQGFTSRGSQPKINVNVQNYLQWIKESMGGEWCLTTDGEMGECVVLTECPTLLDAFLNLNSEGQNMLQDFTCMYEYENIDIDSVRLCCDIMSNFTVMNATGTEIEDLQNISDFRFCGYQHYDDYISFNNEIAIDEFPWLAAIINESGPLLETSICVGTLINQRYVLTSAQCIFSLNSTDTTLVRLGDYILKTGIDCIRLTQFNESECNIVQEYGIEEQMTHPFYNSSTFANDIGLLRLDENVIFTDYVRPICLPMSSTDAAELGEVLYITGFNKYSTHSESVGLKKKIWTTLTSLDVCKEKLKLPSVYTHRTDYYICTKEFQNITDITSCVVDEGGPVMFSKNQQWYIIGISSTFSCKKIEPQTHLKVSKYLKWIRTKIKV